MQRLQTAQLTRDGMAAANKLSARFNSLRPFATRGEAVEGATWGFVTMVRQAQLSPKSIIDRRLTNSRATDQVRQAESVPAHLIPSAEQVAR